MPQHRKGPLPAGGEATLIYNPAAGFWDWGSVVERVARFWSEYGWTVHLEPTHAASHATVLARAAAAAGHGLVLAAGGDGTLNEVANGLVDTPTVLAPLPVGTANSFARELGLARPNLLQPHWLLEVSAALARGRVQRMDVGRCADGRYWLLWASAGVDGFMVRQIEPRPLWFKRLGPAGYAAKALLVLPQFHGVEATVTVDDRTLEGDYLLLNISNCRMFAGGELRLNHAGVLDDGQFEVWLFRGRDWPTVLSYIMDISRAQHLQHRNVTRLRGQKITVQTARPVDYHLDGEPAGQTPLNTTLVPAALRLLVPDTAPPGLFSRPGLRL
jgi:YegS/Rv2252/BmrU family lipid kinase